LIFLRPNASFLKSCKNASRSVQHQQSSRFPNHTRTQVKNWDELLEAYEAKKRELESKARECDTYKQDLEIKTHDCDRYKQKLHEYEVSFFFIGAQILKIQTKKIPQNTHFVVKMTKLAPKK
jgi:hypothetical protein